MKKNAKTKEQKNLLNQVQQIATGLAETFHPFCEVVVHDLLNPKEAILDIHNNISGREIGQSATEIGKARIADSSYSQIISNYPNKFSDGRVCKSTSIGIKDSSGEYIAALCLNIDLTIFNNFQSMIGQFTAVNTTSTPDESLLPSWETQIHEKISQFAAKRSKTPHTLNLKEKRELVSLLKNEGFLDYKRSMETVANHLGVSRAAVYNYAK